MAEKNLYVKDYVDHYIAEGERLRLGGVEPAAPPTLLIAAYPPLRDFLRQHGGALGARGVVSAEIEAGELLVQRLSALLQRGTAPDPTAEQDACAQAGAKLRQLHDALRRLLRSPETASLRARLGVDRPLKDHSRSAVLRGIDQFLEVFRDQQELLPPLRLLPEDLEQLGALRRRLVDLQRTPTPPADAVTMQRARLALDAYFASMAAAICAAFPPEDPRCSAGLALLPRIADRPRTRAPLRPWQSSYPTPDE